MNDFELTNEEKDIIKEVRSLKRITPRGCASTAKGYGVPLLREERLLAIIDRFRRQWKRHACL